jgi:hypothetical protein
MEHIVNLRGFFVHMFGEVINNGAVFSLKPEITHEFKYMNVFESMLE